MTLPCAVEMMWGMVTVMVMVIMVIGDEAMHCMEEDV